MSLSSRAFAHANRLFKTSGYELDNLCLFLRLEQDNFFYLFIGKKFISLRWKARFRLFYDK